MQLKRLIPKRILIKEDLEELGLALDAAPEDEDEKRQERDAKYELIKHHLDDAKEALAKCHGALALGDLDELRDNLVLLQDAGIDAEQILTGHETEV